MILTALAAAAATCTPVPGAEMLFTPERRWVIVGENHGTNETPDAFANLACLAGKTRRLVTVALEYPFDFQPAFDTWLASDGGAAAKAALLALPIWRNSMQDGRTSVASLRLFERLRVLKKRGRITGVRGFNTSTAWNGHGDINAFMAGRLREIADDTHGLVLVLVGNFHAIRSEVARPDGQVVKPAASLLPSKARVSVNVVGEGGSAWNCQSDGCRVHYETPVRSGRTGITASRGPGDRYDATYSIGKPFTAAEPAVPGIADTSPQKIVIKPNG